MSSGREMAAPPQTAKAWEKPIAPGAVASAPMPGAFEATVLVHLDAAYTLARYLTRRGDAADDIVQEALLRAYRSFSSQRGENVRAWLLAIVRNCFLTWKARNGGGTPELNFEDGHEPANECDTARETPETLLIQQQESGAIRTAIEGLPHLFREVLVLRDIEDMSYREIAEITGVPMGTVMSRLSRARKIFAEAWKERETASSNGVRR